MTLYREQVRDRIDDLIRDFLAHGVADPAIAERKAVVAIGGIVRLQAVVLGFSDTFMVIGTVLALVAVLLLLARKARMGSGNGH